MLLFSLWNYRIFSANTNQTLNKITLTVTSVKKVFQELEAENIISNADYVLKVLALLNLDTKIKSGTYDFDNHMGTKAIIDKLLKGEEKTFSFTIIEGHDLYDIDRELLAKKVILKPNAFLDFANLLEKIMQAKKILGVNNIVSLEGLLYPDTYTLRASRPLEDLVNKALINFKDKMLKYFQKNNIPRAEWMGYITLASLVEKETILNFEKPIIAGVIYNRLDRGMKLRFDPTIIYALKKNNEWESNLKNGKINIKRKHFTYPSQFNTYYTRKPLPHPISSVTESSLMAVINPSQHQYLFFVSKSKKNHFEGHDFSNTYQEHLKKIKKYRGR